MIKINIVHQIAVETCRRKMDAKHEQASQPQMSHQSYPKYKQELYSMLTALKNHTHECMPQSA